MDNGSVNNIDEVTDIDEIDVEADESEQKSDERKYPLNRLLRMVMSLSVSAGFIAFVYLLIYFCENTGA